MSVQMKVHKVNTLPGVLEASALYIVKSADTGLLDLYVSANDGLTARHIISKTEIQTMVNTAAAGASNIFVVADIAARDALAPTVVTQAIVVDATDDTSVALGSATYVYDPVGDAWSKIAEHESMDVVLQWANIQGRPSSTVAEIDDAVAKKHAHANMSTLDKFSQDVDGQPTYDGKNLHVYLSSDQW